MTTYKTEKRQEIVVQWGTTNVMGDTSDSEMQWNDSLFRDGFDSVSESESESESEKDSD